MTLRQLRRSLNGASGIEYSVIILTILVATIVLIILLESDQSDGGNLDAASLAASLNDFPVPGPDCRPAEPASGDETDTVVVTDEDAAPCLVVSGSVGHLDATGRSADLEIHQTGDSVIETGRGNDMIHAFGTTSVHTGAGNDHVDIYGSRIEVIDMGPDDDVVRGHRPIAQFDGTPLSQPIDLGNGNDSLSISCEGDNVSQETVLFGGGLMADVRNCGIYVVAGPGDPGNLMASFISDGIEGWRDQEIRIAKLPGKAAPQIQDADMSFDVDADSAENLGVSVQIDPTLVSGNINLRLGAYLKHFDVSWTAPASTEGAGPSTSAARFFFQQAADGEVAIPSRMRLAMRANAMVTYRLSSPAPDESIPAPGDRKLELVLSPAGAPSAPGLEGAGLPKLDIENVNLVVIVDNTSRCIALTARDSTGRNPDRTWGVAGGSITSSCPKSEDVIFRSLWQSRDYDTFILDDGNAPPLVLGTWGSSVRNGMTARPASIRFRIRTPG